MAVRPDRSRRSRGSAWAMLVVVMVSIPAIWELFQRNEHIGLGTLRLLVAIIAIICLASAAYIKEYLARRELDFDFALANDRLRLAMEASTSVGWDFEESRAGAMFCSATCKQFLEYPPIPT